MVEERRTEGWGVMDIVDRLMILLSCVDKDDDEMRGARETVEDAVDEIERLREVLKEIADAKISGVIGDGYSQVGWLIKHHTILVNKALAALKEGE